MTVSRFGKTFVFLCLKTLHFLNKGIRTSGKIIHSDKEGIVVKEIEVA